LNINATDFKIS